MNCNFVLVIARSYINKSKTYGQITVDEMMFVNSCWSWFKLCLYFRITHFQDLRISADFLKARTYIWSHRSKVSAIQTMFKQYLFSLLYKWVFDLYIYSAYSWSQKNQFFFFIISLNSSRLEDKGFENP